MTVIKQYSSSAIKVKKILGIEILGMDSDNGANINFDTKGLGRISQTNRWL